MTAIPSPEPRAVSPSAPSLEKKSPQPASARDGVLPALAAEWPSPWRERWHARIAEIGARTFPPLPPEICIAFATLDIRKQCAAERCRHVHVGGVCVACLQRRGA